MSDEDVFAGVYEVTLALPDVPEPSPGLVVKWRRRGDLWEGLVTSEIDGRVVTAWVPALMLAPSVAS